MEKVSVKCPFCGNDFSEDFSYAETTCPKCNNKFSVEKGIKYYKSVSSVIASKEKRAMADTYRQLELLLEEGEFYCKNEQFDLAIEVYNKALNISTENYKAYLGLVIAYTKNFEDYSDKKHMPYLLKAIELCDDEQKAYVKNLYSKYYEKRKLGKDEIEEYTSQEIDFKFSKIEELLKAEIPSHYQRKKQLGLIKMGFGAFSALTVISAIFVIIFNLNVLYYITVGTFLVAFSLLLAFSSMKSKVVGFDATLDLFDNVNDFELDYITLKYVAKQMAEIATKYKNKDVSFSINENYKKIATLICSNGNDKAKTFIENTKPFNK